MNTFMNTDSFRKSLFGFRVISQEYNSYMLDFMGKVFQPSSKNLQLVEDRNEDQSKNDVVCMQFGKLKKGKYEIDVAAPFSILQAVAVAFSATRS